MEEEGEERRSLSLERFLESCEPPACLPLLSPLSAVVFCCCCSNPSCESLALSVNSLLSRSAIHLIQLQQQQLLRFLEFNSSWRIRPLFYLRNFPGCFPGLV